MAADKKAPFSLANVFLVLCLCVMMVHAKNIETSSSGRYRRTVDSQSAASCDNVENILSSLNITSPAKSRGSICGGECCDNQAEDLLRKQGQKDFAGLLRHNSRSLQGLLSYTAATIQTHVSELSHQSENKTLLLFSQVYKGMAVLSREPINRLYDDMRAYVLVNTTKAEFSSATIDLKTSVTNFFTDFFPLVYHHILLSNNPSRDFTPDFKTCLKKTYDTILPFGDIPKQIGDSLFRSLEAIRLLLQAFRIGTEVLSTTDSLLIDERSKDNAECHEALLKMTHCPKCLGLSKHTKPCSGYCLNVLRGCLTKYVAELDTPWNGYVDGIESLVNAMKRNSLDSGVSAHPVIRGLDTKISEAIMRAMEQGQIIDSKVKRSCGSAVYSAKEDPLMAESTTAIPSTSKPRLANPRVFVTLPETQLLHFQTSIAKSRGFYGNLADTLCQDESFAEQKDKSCWNGERIAEYTKTVVDVGLDMQKYNPEVKPMTNLQNVDPRIADLVDKLRHVHHMAMSSIGSNGGEADYMQRDSEGSGSGSGPDFDDVEEEYGVRGSGSGHGPITDGGDAEGRHNSDHSPKKTQDSKSPVGGGGTTKSSVVVISVVLVALSRLY